MNLNPNVSSIDYRIRGPLTVRASELEVEIRSGKRDDLQQVIRVNIGDCQAMGQQPITFISQVLACCMDVSLINSPGYPSDVKLRASMLLKEVTSLRSYSDTCGIRLIRQHCAEFISSRDGFESSYENIFLTTGASEAVTLILNLINTSSVDSLVTGIMIPIPQYPLYSATISCLGMRAVHYFLEEDDDWEISVSELERALVDSKNKCITKALVVINPGNPTGSLLSKKTIEQIIRFAQKHELLLIADEVFQQNVYSPHHEFVSFKRMMCELGIESVTLISLMSASKGYAGETGARAGYCELFNTSDDLKNNFIKMLSARICSPVMGQVILDCIVKPPVPGDESFERFSIDRERVLRTLGQNIAFCVNELNSWPGMSCRPVPAAMSVFPRVHLPHKVIQAAERSEMSADGWYASELLEEAGICVVPGSGFGQKSGTYHFRIAVPPQFDRLVLLLQLMRRFYENLMQKYA